MLWTIVFPNSQSNRASDKNSRCKKSSCYARSFVGYTQICQRFPYLDKYSSINYHLDKKKKQTESCYQSKGDSSVLHWASCTAHKNHVIRQVSAHIPRTRYCFSINGPCKQAQCSLALERAGDLYFSLHNFCAQILPFNLKKLRKLSKAKKKKRRHS